MKSALVVALFVAVAVCCVRAEEESAYGEEPPRYGARLVKPKIFGNRKQPINIVPRGDPRASAPTAPIAPVRTGLSRNAAFNGARGSKAGVDAFKRGRGIPEVIPKLPQHAVFGANYGNNKCITQGGQCQLTTTCGGIVTRNLCPGPSYITCCTYTSTQCAAISGSCKDTSTCLGTVVKGLCPGGNNIACCTETDAVSGVFRKPPVAQGGNCLANFNGAALATRALAWQDAYRKNGVRYDQVRRQFGASPPVTYADCSSFVTSVLDSLGWNCLFAVGRTTAAMIPQMKVRGGFHTAPKTGDIAMWSSHTGVVVQGATECANSGVRMVAMGDHGAADTGCITVDALKGWGSGTFLGFWTPW